MVSVVGPASGLVSVVEPVSGLVSTVASALTDGATSAAPTAKTSEQPKRKCLSPSCLSSSFFLSNPTFSLAKNAVFIKL